MRHWLPNTLTLILVACGGSAPPPATPDESEVAAPEAAEAQAEPASEMDEPAGEEPSGQDAPEAGAGADGDNTFVLRNSKTAGDARGATASKIKPSATEAAMKFFVIDKQKDAPIPGIVIAMTAPDGKKYYTAETDQEGYAEVLVPVGQKYDLQYVSLGRGEIAASVPVSDEANQNIKLTLRYKGFTPDKSARGFVLNGVNFDTAKAKLRPESFPRLDSVVEYMTHKKSARIRISGHTDNVGNPKSNQLLSEQRAQACRDYLVSKGIDGSRIEAVGYGDSKPIASNATVEGRQENRRIEATEL